MTGDLEIIALDALPHLSSRHRPTPEPGAKCANCDSELQGPYCHVCGQDSDTHKRSVLHLAWEAIEGLLHLDGRLMRTLPMLAFRPGALAKDFMEGRLARHTPPFRTFLVALLLFIFAAEGASKQMNQANERREAAEKALLATPKGRAEVSARMRADADKAYKETLAEAANDRDDDLKDPDNKRDKVLARYDLAKRIADAVHAAALAQADRVAAGQPEDPEAERKATEAVKGAVADSVAQSNAPQAVKDAVKAGTKHRSDFAQRLHDQAAKAKANPEYYFTVMFNWAHRLAVLLLPILGVSLAIAYLNKRQYFFYDHLLVAMDILAFFFLLSAAVMVLPLDWMGWAAAAGALWIPVNLFQTLRGAYGSSVFGALIKTLFVWVSASVSFFILLCALMVFALYQL